MKLENKIDNL